MSLESDVSLFPFGSSQRHLAAEILDRLPDAVAVCDRHLRIRGCNAAARRLFATRATVTLIGDRLRIAHSHDEMITTAIAHAIDQGVSTTFDVPRVGQTGQIVRVDPGLPSGHSSLALVSVRDIDAYIELQARSARERFRFTPAESLLAEYLMKGCTVEQYATQRALRVSTVRSQLSALFAKTGTQRQGELVSRLLSCQIGLGPDSRSEGFGAGVWS